MIVFIRGVVVSCTVDSIVLDNNGIGYRIFMANPSTLIVNENILIHTYQQFREDATTLFGFQKQEEHDLFVRLISVKGIGPKIAMGAMSTTTCDQIVAAIECGDAVALKRLPGIGAKAAAQIILDLKGKLIDKEDTLTNTNSHLQDAVEALLALGYKNSEIRSIMNELSKDNTMSVDAYIRKALTLISKKKGV